MSDLWGWDEEIAKEEERRARWDVLWSVIGALLLVLVLLIALFACSELALAQGPGPQDVVFDEFVYLPVAGEKACPAPWANGIELRSPQVVIDPYTKLELELWIYGAQWVWSWDGDFSYYSSAWPARNEYEAGLWHWAFRFDDPPRSGPGWLWLHQWGTFWPSGAEEGHLASVSLRDDAVHEGYVSVMVQLGFSAQYEDEITYYVMPCAADFNNDGIRDIWDMMTLAYAIGSEKGEPGYVSVFDMDGDGMITWDDYDLAYQYWNVPCL